jgi:alpha-galactosidase
MRVGPDILPEPHGGVLPQPDVPGVIGGTRARSWTNGRLWAADPDSLVVRAEIRDREQWAAHVAAYGGLTFSGDRLEKLDGGGSS